jgi:hypothetical protein
MPSFRFVFALPILFLAACAGNPQSASGPHVGGTPDFDDSIAPEQQAALPAALPAFREPARLKGLSTTQIKTAFGSPAFTRRDAPAEIWQYRGRACTLDLFLYDDGAGQTVAHYAMRGVQPLDERACLMELSAPRRDTPQS